MPNFAKTQSINIGDIKVSFLADGGGLIDPIALFTGSTPEGWQAYPSLLNEAGKFVTSLGAFLIETDEQLVAFDTGMGPVHVDMPGFGPFTGGQMLDSLASLGVKQEEVTEVVFSHLHADHVGWTTLEVEGNRQLTFPKARHMVTAVEWDYWQSSDSHTGPHLEIVQQHLTGKMSMLAEGDTVAPGVTVVSTPGHTPGHISLLVTAGDERLYLLADVLLGPMQVSEPTWGIAFDQAAGLAQQTRNKLYPELIKPNTLTAANHFSDTVFGRVVEVEGEKSWQPLER